MTNRDPRKWTISKTSPWGSEDEDWWVYPPAAIAELGGYQNRPHPHYSWYKAIGCAHHVLNDLKKRGWL